MLVRKVVFVSAALLTTCAAVILSYPARAQQSQVPFTIHRPPDGSTVREIVRVQMPRAAIKDGASVGIFIDGKFREAVAPTNPTTGKPNDWFSYNWDTKALDPDKNPVSDGEHKIKVVLYDPAAAGGTQQAGTESEVRVVVSNQITNPNSPLLMRYHFKESLRFRYTRTNSLTAVAARSGINAETDPELSSAVGTLEFEVQDMRGANALVRNKLINLTSYIKTGTRRYSEDQLSGSLYQELTTLGNAVYERISRPREYGQQSLPIGISLELPALPKEAVTIGSEWDTPGQRLNLPGIPGGTAPKVIMRSRLDGLEWQNGYPAARIHQTYEGAVGKQLDVGGIVVTRPKVVVDRILWIAYKSGVLLRVTDTTTVSGQTTVDMNDVVAGKAAPGGGNPGGNPGGPGNPGMIPGGGPGMMPGGPANPGGNPGFNPAGGGNPGGGNPPGVGRTPATGPAPLHEVVLRNSMITELNR